MSTLKYTVTNIQDELASIKQENLSQNQSISRLAEELESVKNENKHPIRSNPPTQNTPRSAYRIPDKTPISNRNNYPNDRWVPRTNPNPPSARPSKYLPLTDPAELLEEKKSNCVIKNVKEKESAEETITSDSEMIHGILKRAGVDDSTVKEIRRHAERRPGERHYSRPLKVLCHTPQARDIVYTALLKYRKDLLPIGAYIRPDMAPQQLVMDRKLRNDCRRWNEEIGWKRFVVHNLSIVDRDYGLN